jgi:sugar lactone lactonase YvrE
MIPPMMGGDRMRIENDNGLSALLELDSATRICTGFTFTEGPIWIPGEGCLLFTDIPANRIHRWRPSATDAEIYREPSGHANGLTLDHDGKILACEHSERQISSGAYGEIERTLVYSFEGKRFNSPNDIVVHSSGAIYFTDPPYGLGQSDVKELDFQGVYRLGSDSLLSCVVREFTAPNGLAFSPDESVLYIGDSEDEIIERFRVEADGSLSGGELFSDQSNDGREGWPDGMKVDIDGRLWTTGAGGVWVIESDGTVLGQFVLPEKPSNVAFGGPEFATLYVTAQSSVYSVDTNVRGIAPGSS